MEKAHRKGRCEGRQEGTGPKLVELPATLLAIRKPLETGPKLQADRRLSVQTPTPLMAKHDTKPVARTTVRNLMQNCAKVA